MPSACTASCWSASPGDRAEPGEQAAHCAVDTVDAMTPLRRFTSSVLEPHERGVEFGSHHATEVGRTVAAYRALFAAKAGGPFDVDHWGEAAWQRIGELAPAMAEEIAGIATGAGLPVHLVAALNARTELLAVAAPLGVDECSTVVSLPSGRRPVACQTWDWYAAMADGWLHWTIPHPDGRVVRTITEYGVLGKIGVNGHGVGVLFNMLHHENDAPGEIGLPVHLLSRQLLDAATGIDDALTLASAAKTSASTALTVVEGRDDGGDAVSIELFPGGPGVLAPTDGLLVRTNHFVSDEGRDGCQAATIGPGSALRRETLLDRCGGLVPDTADQVVAAMHHHADVGGVCAHPDPEMDPVLQHATLATVAVDAAASRLSATPGGPCSR